MILYHGSNVEVKVPKILKADKGRDFGPAFYLTPIKAHAERWAKRKVRQEKSGNPIISIFEWNEKCGDLNYKKFNEANLEWLDMIVDCRKNYNFRHNFDIVEGKIADDTVGETILYVVEGIMRKEDAIERLKFQEINSQVAFCSEKSLAKLTFLESYEVK